jgi:hypothetical protein
VADACAALRSITWRGPFARPFRRASTARYTQVRRIAMKQDGLDLETWTTFASGYLASPPHEAYLSQYATGFLVFL